MAFPTTIASATAAIGCGGPFVSSAGNVYLFVPDNTKINLRALKGSSPASAFSAAGTDVVIGSGSDVLVHLDAFQVGDNIHVATKDANGSSPVNYRYHIFSMASDTWTTTKETIKLGISTKPGGSGQTGSVAIGVRTAGDVLVMYNGEAGSFSGVAQERLFYARRTAGVWTADIALDGGGQADWIAGCIVMGGADRTHFIFQDITNAAAYERTLTSANSLETLPAAFDATTYAANESFEQRGIAYTSGGATIINIPYFDGFEVLNNINFNSADVPTLSATANVTSPTAAVNAPAFGIASYAVDGTTVWNAFIDPNADIYTQSNANGAGWTAPSLFYTGTVTNLYARVYSRGGAVVVGIAFQETSLKYTEFTLSAAPSTIGPFRMGLMGVGI